MRTAAFVAALVAGAAAAPQGVTANIAPKEQTPPGCQTTFPGTFQVSTQAIGNGKRSLEERQSVPLETKLVNGVLTDSKGRTGYIAANNQFQFDGPAQTGAIFTAGWSVCQNGSLALGNSAIFYQCLSGTFYNLYDEKTAAQCSPVYLQAISSTSGSGAAPVQAAGDGQITGASAKPGVNTVICQIGDGQLQQNTCITSIIAEATDGQLTITQIGDGQIQAPTGAPPAVTPPPATPVQQGPKITQISDGQIQAPTGRGNGTVASFPAPSTTPTSRPISTFAGAAATPAYKAELLGLAAGVLALAAL